MVRLSVVLMALLLANPIASHKRGLATLVENELRPAVSLSGHPVGAKTLREEMQALHVPGVSVAVIHHGHLVWVKSFGVSDAEGSAVTPATLFQAGSVSKSIAALGLLRLVADGRLTLDQPVNSALTRWKLPDSSFGPASAVTLRELLSHTAGINVHGFPGYPTTERNIPSLDAILDGMPPANTPPVRIVDQPGTGYKYSGGGYLIAQQMAEDVTGEPFAQWAMHGVLLPARMNNSSFALSPQSPFAWGHDKDGVAVSQAGYYFYPESAAAGLWTTPTDLANALLGLSASLTEAPRAILPKHVAEVVLMPVTPGESVGFDTGGARSTRWISKGGDTNGFTTLLVCYPLLGEGAVVMTNGVHGAELASEVVGAVASTYYWPDFRPRTRTSVPIKTEDLNNLPGKYQYGTHDTFEVWRDGKQLLIGSTRDGAEPLLADSSGEKFVLSQDITYIFGGNVSGGYFQIWNVRVPFKKVDDDQQSAPSSKATP